MAWPVSSSGVLDPPSVLDPIECSVVGLYICRKVRGPGSPTLTAHATRAVSRGGQNSPSEVLVRRGLYFSRQNNSSTSARSRVVSMGGMTTGFGRPELGIDAAQPSDAEL